MSILQGYARMKSCLPFDNMNNSTLREKSEKKHNRFHMIVASQNQKDMSETNKIKWIEDGVLENPLPDHRKYIIWRILRHIY
jgi:hypothetical protein